MSIYEGLSEPNMDNFMYASKGMDLVSEDMNNAILNSDRGGLKGIKNKFLEIIAPINPFHVRQQSHPHGYIIPGIRDGVIYKNFMPYPFKKVFESGSPGHFDPTKDTEMPQNPAYNYIPEGSVGTLMTIKMPKVPYVCELEKKKLEICKLGNGGQSGKCESEVNNFLQICPNFALHTYKQNKLFNEKAKLIQRREYHEAMKKETYNKNRTMADVSKNSSYDMGMANSLRPDTMWADDRYINITQKEVDAAKEKLGINHNKFDYSKIKGVHQHPSDEAVYTDTPRMY